MEPQIRYARAPDGVNLAWYSIGTGLPSVWLPIGPYSHLTYGWKISENRQNLENAAAAATVVCYDSRGFSLSDRDVGDFSLESMVVDLETVTDAAGLDRFVLMAPTVTAMVALVYAARHSERVIALLLPEGMARGADLAGPAYDRLLNLARSDWEMTKVFLGGASNLYTFQATVAALQDLLDESTTQDAYVRFYEAIPEWDATPVLDQVKAPVLVVHIERSIIGTLEAARRLAASLPDGAFVVAKDTDEAIQAELDFMAKIALPDEPDAVARASGTGIILFADVVDSTAITEQIGNAAFRDRSRQVEEALRAAIRDAGGAPVEGRTLGDGVLGDFSSASQAIAAAIICREEAAKVGLGLHLGIHAGDVIREAGNVHGIAVSMASRISGLTAPNEILVSSTVRDLARASTDATFEDRGEHALKGIAEPQRVFAVRASEAG